MRQWEYALVTANSQKTGGWHWRLTFEDRESIATTSRDLEWVRALNSLGIDGWELVSESAFKTEPMPPGAFVYGWRYVFKRPIS